VKKYALPLLLFFLLTLCKQAVFAQRVQALQPDIEVDSILWTKPWASKLSFDPISKHLFYTTADGNIYEVFEDLQTDSLRFNILNHGIQKVQGLCFQDSTLFLCGNIWYTTTGIGLVMKGVLQPNGSRIWKTVLTTEAYPTSSSTGDHGFSAINIDPDGQYLYFSSGTRTSFGEVETNNGQYPGLREQALTSKIFRIPISAEYIYLYNDSLFLASSGYVFAEGTRNAYDMAWNQEKHLFSIDNAGDRDDPEELNWLQAGQHYGFPWRIGGNTNPLTNPSYDASQDPLVNQASGAYLSGHFAADPNFPIAPAITFTEPLRNLGSAADYYKEEGTGQIKKASESGVPVRTFTAHRSPLGLVIDAKKQFGKAYSGKGFILSFMPGGDSTGYTPLSPWGSPCPFVDPSRELVMMDLFFDSTLQDYAIKTSNVVTGFYLPVDAEQVGNQLYIIENNGALWKLSFPLPDQIPAGAESGIFAYPNPIEGQIQIYYPNPSLESRYLELNDLDGKLIWRSNSFQNEFLTLPAPFITNGAYYLEIKTANKCLAKQKVLFVQ
jgi:hypothetical protein